MMDKHIPFINQLRTKVSNEYHGKILYLTISGSDLYGFSSKDSDIDIRGSWQLGTNKMLGLHIPKETIEFETKKDGVVEYEAVLHELKKELGLIIKGNCNIYEHVFAEPLETSIEHQELKDLADQMWNIAGIYNSYRGMAYQNYNKFILGGKHSVKKYLYVLRGLLAGTYALTERRIEPNLEVLNEYFNEPVVAELIDLKKRGLEKDPVRKMDRYDQCCDKYFKEIDKVYETHPDKTERVDDRIADRWLKEQRLEYLEE